MKVNIKKFGSVSVSVFNKKAQLSRRESLPKIAVGE